MKSRVDRYVTREVNLNGFGNDIDVEEALDATGHGLYNYLILVASCTIHLGSVVDMLGFSIVVPAASCDLQLGLKESGMLTSASFAGFMFALPWGYFADTRGRRKALLISASLGFMFAVLCSLSTNFVTMLVLKFVGCSFSTASITLTTTYLGECTPKRLRSRFIFIQNVYSLAADLSCYVLAYFILPMDFEVRIPWLITLRPWRLLIVAMALPLGIGVVMMSFLKESPKFLANAGETDKALKVLTKFHKVNTGSNLYPVKSILGRKNEEESSSLTFWESVVKQTVPIFKPPLLWRTLQLFYLWSICCSTNNVFFMWFPVLANSFYNTNPVDINSDSFCQKIIANISTGGDNTTETCIDSTPINTIYSGILFTLFFTTLNIVIIKLSSWRKVLLIITFIISGGSAVMVNWFYGAIPEMIFFTMIQFTGICIGTVGSYYVDMYPTSYRGLATSLGMMATRFVCLGGVNLVGALVVDYCSITFYSWGTYVLSGVLVAMFLPSDRDLKQMT